MPISGSVAVSARASALAQGLRVYLGGFDFRASDVYVTDPANSTYVLQASLDAYPTTRNGFTFGWTSGPGSAQAANRDLTNDPRIAGCVIANNVEADFRLDLPSPGDYIVSLALGDALNATRVTCQLFDGVNLLDTIASNETVAIDAFVDTTGKQWSFAEWPSKNQPRKFTFTTSQLILKLGGAGLNTSIAHLFIQTAAVVGSMSTWDSETGTWDASGESWDGSAVGITGNSLHRLRVGTSSTVQLNIVGAGAAASNCRVVATGSPAHNFGNAASRTSARISATSIERYFGTGTVAAQGAGTLAAALSIFRGAVAIASGAGTMATDLSGSGTWDSQTGTWDTTSGTWDQASGTGLNFGAGHSKAKIATSSTAALRFAGTAAAAVHANSSAAALNRFTGAVAARTAAATSVAALERFTGSAAARTNARVLAQGPATANSGSIAVSSKAAVSIAALEKFTASAHGASSLASASSGLERFSGAVAARVAPSISTAGLERFLGGAAAASKTAIAATGLECTFGAAAVRTSLATAVTGREVCSGSAAVASKTAVLAQSSALFSGSAAARSSVHIAATSTERFFGGAASATAPRTSSNGVFSYPGAVTVAARVASSATALERFSGSAAARTRPSVTANGLQIISGGGAAAFKPGQTAAVARLSFGGAIAVAGIPSITAQGVRGYIGSFQVAVHAGTAGYGLELYVSLASEHFFRVQKERRHFKAGA